MILAALLVSAALQDPLSPDLLEYQPAARLRGTLQLGPAPGFENLIEGLAERLKQHHPDLRGGQAPATTSSTPQAMTKGGYRLGLLGRRWTGSEVSDFRFQWGYRPTELVIAIDAFSIVVHPDNPIRQLSLEEIETIFSSAERRGNRPLRTWGDLGLNGEWKQQRITLYGMDKQSSGRRAFQERALRGAEFAAGVRDGSGKAVLNAVAEDPGAIGFVRGCQELGQCRAVPLRPLGGAAGVEPKPESVLAFSYPLAWPVYVAVRKEPGEPLDPETAEFLRLVFSRDGQSVVADAGFLPITGMTARQESLKLK